MRAGLPGGQVLTLQAQLDDTVGDGLVPGDEEPQGTRARTPRDGLVERGHRPQRRRLDAAAQGAAREQRGAGDEQDGTQPWGAEAGHGQTAPFEVRASAAVAAGEVAR